MLMLNAVPKVVTGKVIANQVQFPVWLTERMLAAYSELTAECDIFKSQVEQQTLTHTLATETTSSNSGFLKKTWITSQVLLRSGTIHWDRQLIFKSAVILEASVTLRFLWTVKDWTLVPQRKIFAVISSHCLYGVLVSCWIQIWFSLSLYLWKIWLSSSTTFTTWLLLFHVSYWAMDLLEWWHELHDFNKKQG